MSTTRREGTKLEESDSFSGQWMEYDTFEEVEYAKGQLWSIFLDKGLIVPCVPPNL